MGGGHGESSRSLNAVLEAKDGKKQEVKRIGEARLISSDRRIIHLWNQYHCERSTRRSSLSSLRRGLMISVS